MKMILSLASALAAAFALMGATIAQAAPSDDPASVQAGTYNVEPTHTRVLFSVTHFGFTHYYGDFTGVTGKLSIDPKNIGAADVEVTIPTASVSTTNARLDGELKGANWLNASTYPAMTFVSRRVTRTGPKTARIDGDLTLRGVTHPVSLDATFNAAGPYPMGGRFTVGFDAVGHLKRSDFGVSPYLGLISDDVDIIISAAFQKAD
ncbi:MAG TPA: YceI family protein [Caulobacteraceae bacterium]|nr:YceI family protein [Caulobacteraceae bacterium]